jgi:hypothetical protein
MRVNLYEEELTDEIKLVTTEAEGRTFYGVRFFLASANELHHTASDDDRSAVTFWLRTKENAERFFNGALHSIKQS